MYRLEACIQAIHITGQINTNMQHARIMLTNITLEIIIIVS